MHTTCSAHLTLLLIPPRTIYGDAVMSIPLSLPPLLRHADLHLQARRPSKIWVPISTELWVGIFCCLGFGKGPMDGAPCQQGGGVLCSPDNGRTRQISQNISPNASPVRQLLQHTCYAHTLSTRPAPSTVGTSRESRREWLDAKPS